MADDKYLLGEDYITNDITQIEQVKSTFTEDDDGNLEAAKNYNAGRVKLKCFINRYCPVNKGLHTNYGLVFNSFTLKSVPEEVLKNFSFVPGLEGLFLKPRISYRSNFIVFPIESHTLAPLNLDNLGEKLTAEKYERIEKYTDSIFPTFPDYAEYQTWVAVTSPIDGKKVPPEADYVCDDDCPSNQSRARWKYTPFPRVTDSDNNNEEDKDKSQEPEDSYVLFPSQMASAPLIIEIKPPTKEELKKELEEFNKKAEDYIEEKGGDDFSNRLDKLTDAEKEDMVNFIAENASTDLIFDFLKGNAADLKTPQQLALLDIYKDALNRSGSPIPIEAERITKAQFDKEFPTLSPAYQDWINSNPRLPSGETVTGAAWLSAEAKKIVSNWYADNASSGLLNYWIDSTPEGKFLDATITNALKIQKARQENLIKDTGGLTAVSNANLAAKNILEATQTDAESLAEAKAIGNSLAGAAANLLGIGGSIDWGTATQEKRDLQSEFWANNFSSGFINNVIKNIENNETNNVRKEIENRNKLAAAYKARDIQIEKARKEAAKDAYLKKQALHWRVKKKTPLFKGQDFFFEFRNISVEKDIKNIDSKEFVDKTYNFMDVNFKGDTALSVTDGKVTGHRPINQSVVTYKKKITKADGFIGVEYEKGEDSIKFFDFHRQPYLILEMKGTGGHYFFVFAEKYNPICFKAVDVTDGDGESVKVSYLLSEYKKVVGKQLFSGVGFTMSVRNHLGRIVITFSSLEGSPWIIDNIEKRVESKEDVIFRTPANCELYLWGGSNAIAFSFNPLQYNKSATISLPPSPKKVTGSSDDIDDDEPGFTVNDLGIGSHHMVLSTSDMIPQKFNEGKYKRVTYYVEGSSEQNEDGESTNIGDDLYLQTSNHFYGCDAHEIREVYFTRGNNEAQIFEKGLSNALHGCKFTNTDDYIKDSEVSTLTVPSKIYINSEISTNNLGVMDSNLGVSSQDLEKNIKNLKSFVTSVELSAGSHMFVGEKSIEDFSIAISNEKTKNPQRSLLESADAQQSANTNRFDSIPEGAWVLKNCITPVVTHLRLVSIPLNEGAWTPQGEGLDVSKHVLKFSDSWSAQDYIAAEHSGSISFFVNDSGGQEGTEASNFPHSEELEAMKDKAFYIEVWAGYDNCSYTFGKVKDGSEPLYYKLFTGICFGGTITQEPMIRKMECKIVDYSKILKDTLFFNSPFFDGMRDANAVYEILKMAAFKEIGKGTVEIGDGDGIYGVTDPAALVSSCCDNTGGFIMSTSDRRSYEYEEYALPFSYSRIQDPFFRFKDGSNLYDALVGFAKRGNKMMFFDSFGAFHYQSSMGIKMASLANEELDDYAIWKYRTSETPDIDLESGEQTAWQYVFNVMTKEGTVEDVYNNIHMVTSTPNFEVILGDRTNWDSITDPSIKGFLGYRRTMFQQESLFGRADALKNIMDYYKAFWVPPLVYSFETYGQPLRIFDVARIDDKNILITSISSEIDPNTNRWWQNIQGEYLGVSIAVEEKQGTNRDEPFGPGQSPLADRVQDTSFDNIWRRFASDAYESASSAVQTAASAAESVIRSLPFF